MSITTSVALLRTHQLGHSSRLAQPPSCSKKHGLCCDPNFGRRLILSSVTGRRQLTGVLPTPKTNSARSWKLTGGATLRPCALLLLSCSSWRPARSTRKLRLQNPPVKQSTNNAARGATIVLIPAFRRGPRSARCLLGAFSIHSILAP